MKETSWHIMLTRDVLLCAELGEIAHAKCAVEMKEELQSSKFFHITNFSTTLNLPSRKIEMLIKKLE